MNVFVKCILWQMINRNFRKSRFIKERKRIFKNFITQKFFFLNLKDFMIIKHKF